MKTFILTTDRELIPFEIATKEELNDHICEIEEDDISVLSGTSTNSISHHLTTSDKICLDENHCIRYMRDYEDDDYLMEVDRDNLLKWKAVIDRSSLASDIISDMDDAGLIVAEDKDDVKSAIEGFIYKELKDVDFSVLTAEKQDRLEIFISDAIRDQDAPMDLHDQHYKKILEIVRSSLPRIYKEVPTATGKSTLKSLSSNEMKV